jgi:type IX secretion system PorP/SprF family membrane protein
MKRYITILSIGMLVSLGIASRAQDLHFSQFYDNAILRNPGLTGIFSGDFKFGLDYRNQWGSVTSPYSTTMASGETRFMVSRESADFLSFGVLLTYDKAGSINFTSLQTYASICYNKAIEDQHNSYLSVGFAGGYLNRHVDMSLMTFSSQYVNGNYDQNNATGETSTFNNLNNYDLGAGISLNSSLDVNSRYNYYLGASVYHINSPTEIFSGGAVLVRLPMKWQFGGGLHLPFSDQFGFTVHANYSLQQPYSELIFGGLFTYRSIPVGLPSIFAFHFGAFIRRQDAIIPTVKIDYRDLSFGFSYDATNSSLATGASGAGATELTLYIRSKYEHRKNPRDPIMCPRFEDDVNPNNTFR